MTVCINHALSKELFNSVIPLKSPPSQYQLPETFRSNWQVLRTFICWKNDSLQSLGNFALVSLLLPSFNLIFICSLLHCAAQLPVLFHVCFFLDSSLHLCICNVSLVHQVSHGWGLSNSMEGFQTLSSFFGAFDILFHCSLVCWWTYWISSIPH